MIFNDNGADRFDSEEDMSKVKLKCKNVFASPTSLGKRKTKQINLLSCS